LQRGVVAGHRGASADTAPGARQAQRRDHRGAGDARRARPDPEIRLPAARQSRCRHAAGVRENRNRTLEQGGGRRRPRGVAVTETNLRRTGMKALFGGMLMALAVLSGHATAQDYPTRTVTILVPFAAGGGTDLIARAVAQKLEQKFGRSFVIE